MAKKLIHIVTGTTEKNIWRNAVKLFCSVFIYLFIAGMLAGAVENDMRECRVLTSKENRDILYISLLWPELIGAAIVNKKSPPYPKECDIE